VHVELSERVARVPRVEQIPLRYESTRGVADFPCGGRGVPAGYKYVSIGENRGSRASPRVEKVAGGYKVSVGVANFPTASRSWKTAAACGSEDEDISAG